MKDLILLTHAQCHARLAQRVTHSNAQSVMSLQTRPSCGRSSAIKSAHLEHFTMLRPTLANSAIACVLNVTTIMGTSALPATLSRISLSWMELTARPSVLSVLTETKKQPSVRTVKHHARVALMGHLTAIHAISRASIVTT